MSFVAHCAGRQARSAPEVSCGVTASATASASISRSCRTTNADVFQRCHAAVDEYKPRPRARSSTDMRSRGSSPRRRSTCASPGFVPTRRRRARERSERSSRGVLPSHRPGRTIVPTAVHGRPCGKFLQAAASASAIAVPSECQWHCADAECQSATTPLGVALWHDGWHPTTDRPLAGGRQQSRGPPSAAAPP